MGKYSKKLFVCMSVFLITSMVMTLFLFRTTVQASILGSKYYYLSLERDNFKELKTDFKNKSLQGISCALKLNAGLEGNLVDSDQEIKTLADYISKFQVFIDYSANTKNLRDVYYSSLISAKYDGKKLADVDIKSADNKTLIAFPGLTNKTLGIESPKSVSSSYLAFLGDRDAIQECYGMTPEAYDKIVEKYLKDIIVKNIPDENVVFNNNADFESIKCNSITFNIDQTIMSGIYKALASEIANDKELKALVTSITSSFIDRANVRGLEIEKPTAEEIDSEIKDFCDDLNEEAEDMEEIQFSYTAYFKDNGDILSRQYNDKIGDLSGILSTYKNLFGVDIFQIKFEESNKTVFELIGSKLERESTYEGSVHANAEGKSLLDATYSYEKNAKVGNLDAFVGEINGKINLEQFKNSGEYSSNNLNDIYFSQINSKKDNDTLEGKTKISTKYDGKSVGLNVFTELKQSNVAKAKPVVSINDSIKLNDYTKLDEMGREIEDSLQEICQDLFPSLNIDDEDIE